MSRYGSLEELQVRHHNNAQSSSPATSDLRMIKLTIVVYSCVVVCLHKFYTYVRKFSMYTDVLLMPSLSK